MSLTALAAAAIGLHIASIHAPDNGQVDNTNPGAYVRVDGVTVGAYRNSIRRTSVYATYSIERGPFALAAGVVSGYDKAHGGHSRGALAPLIAVSVRGPEVFGLTPRLSYVPGHLVKSADVIHAQIEKRF